jgi:hypothetical protein
MTAAIDPKPPKRRFDQHPRLARVARKKPPVTLGDDAAQVMLFYGLSERDYRETLFRDFVRFCRDAGAWVVSAPFERRCRVLMPPDSPLLERLAQLPKYPVVKMPNVQHRLQGVTELQIVARSLNLFAEDTEREYRRSACRCSSCRSSMTTKIAKELAERTRGPSRSRLCAGSTF